MKTNSYISMGKHLCSGELKSKSLDVLKMIKTSKYWSKYILFYLKISNKLHGWYHTHSTTLNANHYTCLHDHKNWNGVKLNTKCLFGCCVCKLLHLYNNIVYACLVHIILFETAYKYYIIYGVCLWTNYLWCIKKTEAKKITSVAYVLYPMVKYFIQSEETNNWAHMLINFLQCLCFFVYLQLRNWLQTVEILYF